MSIGLNNSQVLLNEYIKQEYAETCQYSSKDDFFEFFAASQVLKSYDLSDEEIEHGICDAALDGGCDSIYLFADGVLLNDNIILDDFKKGTVIDFYIIQSKNTKSFGESALQNWKTVCSNLFDMDKNPEDFRTRYNEKVRMSFELFRNVYIALIRKSPKINIIFCYVTKGIEVHPNVLEQSKELCDLVQSLYPNVSTRVDFIGAPRLLEFVNKVVNNTFQLILSENPITNASSKVFVALVNIANYYKFMVNEKNELIRHIFEANVRDYQGKVAVNKDIQETLETTSGKENFWWLNNGATIIASDAKLVTGKTLVLDNPEIVNGLQTSTEIFNYFKNHPERLEDDMRDLLVRIIVPESEDSRDKIIFATNNQTPIQKSSLRATDTIHRQIEMYFKSRSLYYDRRKNYYKNNGKKAAQIVSLPFLSQCLIAVLLQSPNDARARPSTLLADDERYQKLYRANQNLDVFYNIAFMGKKTEAALKQNSKYTTTQISDIKFYVLFALFAKSVKKIDIAPQDIVTFRTISVDDDTIITIADKIFELYKGLGGNDKVAKGSELISRIKEELNGNNL